MLRLVCVTIFLCLLIIAAPEGSCSLLSNARAQGPLFDVNDVSYLWPAPETKDDVGMLIAADELLADGKTTLWPKPAFDALIDKAQHVAVTGSDDVQHKIDFASLPGEFAKLATWKVAAMRIDPSAPATDLATIEKLGSTPQIRLILQPVTVDATTGTVKIHDLTAHLVFSFIQVQNLPAPNQGTPQPTADRAAFTAIVEDIKALKLLLRQKSQIDTAGKLSVHPGLKAKSPEFLAGIKSMLKNRLSSDRLFAMAFMGIEQSEPWIFFATGRQPDGSFPLVDPQLLKGANPQMLTFRGAPSVVPDPHTANLDAGRGVSTSQLFPNIAPTKLAAAVFPNAARPVFQDIPDIVANPTRANFFNTDCISCHSESTRRSTLHIGLTDAQYRYTPPAGISGVDDAVLPKDIWNVRNFGWFPRGPQPTASLRTANEAAESADFINREYLAKKTK